MFDFFDEDFPLTKKQEEEYRKRLAEEEAAAKEVAVSEPEETSDLRKAASDDIVIEEPVIDKGDSVIDDNDENNDEQPEPGDASEETAVDEPVSEEPKALETVPEEAEPENAESENEVTGSENAEPEPESETKVTEPEKEVPEPEPINIEMKPRAQEPERMPDIGEKIASLDEIEANLHAELKSLGEKLDNMERVVDEMDEGEIAEGFDYEYDERFFAEDETPAYRHPELYNKPKKEQMPTVRHTEKKSDGSITVSKETLVKVGAAVAAAAVAIKLLGKSGKNK